jgi:hypothetical protein
MSEKLTNCVVAQRFNPIIVIIINQTNHSFFEWFIEIATVTGCVEAQRSSPLKNIVKQI